MKRRTDHRLSRLWFGCALWGFALFIWAAVAHVHADEVVLKSKRVIKGKVVHQDDRIVRLRTAAGSTLDLPKSIIASVNVEQLGPEETMGDLALTQHEHEKALRCYRQAKQAGNASDNIDEKIRRVLEIIRRREREQFDRFFQEAQDMINRGETESARRNLDRILASASEGGPYWTMARRVKALTYFRKALSLLDRVQYVPAIREIEKSVKADPTLASGYLRLAELYSTYTSERDLADTYYDKGIEVGAEELKREPEELKRLEALAPAEARLTRERLITARYDHASLKYRLGRTLEAAEDFLALLEEYADAMRPEQRDQAIRKIVDAYTSVDLTREFDHDKILRQLDVALEKDPGASQAWYLKGLIYLDDKRTSEAIQSFTSAIEIGTAVPDRYLKRAEAYLDQGKSQLAKADLRKELEIFERYEVRVRLAEVYMMGADYDKAIENFTIAIDDEPDEVPALLGRARAYRRKALVGNLAQTRRDELLNMAEKDVRNVIELKGDLLDALLVLGQIFKDRKQYDEAQEHFTRVINGLEAIKKELSPAEKTSLARAYTERADIHLKRNDRNLARSDCNRALGVLKEFAPAYAMLGEAAKLLGDHKAARENYLKAIELDPLNADNELYLAILLHQYLNQPGYAEAAIKHYETYLEKGGKEPRVRDWIRECRAGVVRGENGK